MTLSTIEIQAPAKINIGLAIKHKRQDGYHELETVMQKIDLVDRIQLTKIESGITLRCTVQTPACKGYSVPTDETNIAYRAAVSFFAESRCAGGVEITLGKNIPVAAGLGGGSSDAGAVLTGLCTLFPGALSFQQSMVLAGKLGADVPFFVHPASAVFAAGIGDDLHPIAPISGCAILLVNPGFSVSTQWVYDNFALTSEDNTYTLAPDFAANFKAAWFADMATPLQQLSASCFYNDLERVSLPKYPEIDQCKKQLIDHGAEFALMSGSGPTTFGIFSDRERASRCFAAFKKKYADVFLCQPL